MKNRDFFYRERQAGGRTVHDYGHTKLRPDQPETTPMWVLGAVGAFVALALVLL